MPGQKVACSDCQSSKAQDAKALKCTGVLLQLMLIIPICVLLDYLRCVIFILHQSCGSEMCARARKHTRVGWHSDNSAADSDWCCTATSKLKFNNQRKH